MWGTRLKTGCLGPKPQKDEEEKKTHSELLEVKIKAGVKVRSSEAVLD